VRSAAFGSNLEAAARERRRGCAARVFRCCSPVASPARVCWRMTVAGQRRDAARRSARSRAPRSRGVGWRSA